MTSQVSVVTCTCGISLLRAPQCVRAPVADHSEFTTFQVVKIAGHARPPVAVTDNTNSNHNVLLVVGKTRNRLLGLTCAVGIQHRRGVLKRILMSSHTDHDLAYSRSRRTISSNGTLLRPPTCHKPVMPGLTASKRRLCHTP